MPVITHPADLLIPVAEVSRRLGVSVSTVWRWTREEPTFPAPIRLGAGTTRWSAKAIARWVDARLEVGDGVA